MRLNEGEKIDYWDVVVTTTEGRKLSLGDLRIDQLLSRITPAIDNLIEENYPVMWIDEKN